MLESQLTIKNFYWTGNSFRPPVKLDGDEKSLFETLATLRGQYAFAAEGPGGKVTLGRDRLGSNKLFFAIHRSGRIQASNYIVDLVRSGVPFQAIFSVPAGHLVTIDPNQQVLVQRPCFQAVTDSENPKGSYRSVAKMIRQHLELWFARFARAFGDRRIFLCLSGGLDSGLVAAFAKQYFSDITAYTYGYSEGGETWSEDVSYAERLADFLGIDFRLVPASAEDISAAVEPALCYGQDWRDFNVHCAVVNEILAAAMKRDLDQLPDGRPVIILTGDLMNEFLADYTPVTYCGREYYTLPRLELDRLRLILIRGLDAGDREIGIFNRHGLDIFQPYGCLIDPYLNIPGALIGQPEAKQHLVRQIAGDLLPPFILKRTKVRAQIGSSKETAGILPLFVHSGRNSAWLKRAFCGVFAVPDPGLLDQFIRAGVYRFTREFPKEVKTDHGYFTR